LAVLKDVLVALIFAGARLPTLAFGRFLKSLAGGAIATYRDPTSRPLAFELWSVTMVSFSTQREKAQTIGLSK
jgi:hypothetical protein